MTYRNHIVFICIQAKIDFFHVSAKQLPPKITHISSILINTVQRNAPILAYSCKDVLYLPLPNLEIRAPYALRIDSFLFHARRLMHTLDRSQARLRAVQVPQIESLGIDLHSLEVSKLAYAYEVLTYRPARAIWALQSVQARLGPNT